jgi:maleate isomerase
MISDAFLTEDIMWQPDGWGARARIGILMPHFDLGPEAEFEAMAPDGVTIHSTRVRIGVTMPGAATDPGIALAPVRAFAEPPAIDDAAELLAAAPLHAIAYGFFSSSYVLGVEGDRAFQARLEKRTHGIPVVIPGLAALRALRALGVRRLALVDPPWFSAELNRMGADYFRSQQMEVVYAAPATGLPISQHDQHPGRLYEWVRAQMPANAEAVLTGGNGFRAVGAIEALEEDLGRPVLTANSVTFWNALRAAGVRTTVAHYGRLFAQPLPGD